jgi:hypothetical protein
LSKQFVKVPNDRVEKILMFADIAENISGKKVTKEEVMKRIKKDKIELTKEQKQLIDDKFN